MTMGARRDGSAGRDGVTAGAVADGGAPTGDARAARGRVWARLADAAGLGCLLSTLLVYTAAVSPFQRYATVELFVPPTTRACLRAAFVVSLVALALVILSARARRAPAGEGAPAARAGAARPEA
ncbi:hypothetical protein I3I95_09515, partial [bacterium]|nr:hypothetical protein [bacterium]